MNPPSFVTVFTFGELGTLFALALVLGGGYHKVMMDLSAARPVMFWLFLGGFCWVLGDLFQQYAAKCNGISRGIPLSNTNQLWGLAWGALVFGELAGQPATAQVLVVAWSLVMIAGAAAICSAEAPQSEHAARRAIERECERYGMDLARVEASMQGEDVLARQKPRRHWWESLVGLAALGIFIWLGTFARRAPITVDVTWIAGLSVATAALLVICGLLLCVGLAFPKREPERRSPRDARRGAGRMTFARLRP